MENCNTESYLKDYLQAVEKQIAHSPIGSLLGIRILSAEEGRLVAEMDAQDKLLNSLGTIHGGVIASLADAVMGLACGTMLKKTSKFTTLEFKINFIKPVISGVIIGIGKVQHIGKSSCVSEAEIYDQDKQLVAKSTSTLLIL